MRGSRRRGVRLFRLSGRVLTIGALVGLLTSFAGPAGAAKGATLTEAYAGGTIDMFPASFCRTDARVPNPAQRNVGKVCFSGLTSAGEYKLHILDVSGSSPCFTYSWMWRSVAGWYAADYGDGCEEAVTLIKPPGAVRLEVLLHGPILWNGRGGGLSCCPSIATKGKVTLTKPSVRRAG